MRADGLVGYIPANGRLRGILNTNVAPLGGRPLVEQPVELAVASGLFKAVFVSTEAVAAIARAHGAEVLEHPEHLAQARFRRLPGHHVPLAKAAGLTVGCGHGSNAGAEHCEVTAKGRSLGLPINRISGLDIDTPDDLQFAQLIPRGMEHRNCTLTEW